MVLLRVLIPLPRNQGEVSEEIFHFQLVNQKKKKKRLQKSAILEGDTQVYP